MAKKIIFLMAAFGFIALASPMAFSHSALVSSNPAAGADLSEAPDEVRLKFNEELLRWRYFASESKFFIRVTPSMMSSSEVA
jgi:methionine-rich copper-binding protein CopC